MPDPASTPRAAFTRGRRPLADGAADLLTDLVLDSTVGFPLPRGPRPSDDEGSGLPPRFVVEVADLEVRVLDDGGEGLVESWPRGTVTAHVHSLDEDEIVLALRWPGGERAGRIMGAATPEARRVAELLAADTRAQRGADREGDARLRRLAVEALPDELLTDQHAALAELALLLREGERPLVVAGAWRGMRTGLVLLTGDALHWASGARREPLLLAREEIASAAVDMYRDTAAELSLERRAARRVTLDLVEPVDAAHAIARELVPSSPDPLDALLAEADEDAKLLVAKPLERVRDLLAPDERPLAFTRALRGTRVGALVVTDRRLLWVGRRAEPLEVERASIRAVRTRDRRFKVTELELDHGDGATLRFDSIEPPARAALIVDALADGAT